MAKRKFDSRRLNVYGRREQPAAITTPRNRAERRAMKFKTNIPGANRAARRRYINFAKVRLPKPKKQAAPKQRQKPITVQQLMDLTPDQISAMPKEEIDRYLKRAATIVNNRYEDLLDKVGRTSAVRILEKSGGAIDKDQKTRNQAIEELTRALKFMGFTTGTVGGYRKYVAAIDRRIARRSGLGSADDRKLFRDLLNGLTTEEQTEMWQTIKYIEGSAAYQQSYISSDQLQAYVATNYVTGRMTATEILNRFEQLAAQAELENRPLHELTDSEAVIAINMVKPDTD